MLAEMNFELLLTTEAAIAAAVVAIVGLGLGFAVATGGAKRKSLEALRAIERRAGTQEAGLTKRLSILQRDNEQLRELLHLFPGYSRRLTETSSTRHLAPLISEMALRMCVPPPQKLLILYLARHHEELVVVSNHGHEEHLPIGLRMPSKTGRLGYVFHRGRPMDSKDFRGADLPEWASEDNLPFATEVAVPIRHRGERIGVICAEGFPAYDHNAKSMISVAANLGGIAFVNTHNMSLVRRKADEDGLTGLFNKGYLLQRLPQELERAAAEGEHVSVFILDIDHFKLYNDQNGHQEGDVALKMMGELLTANTRDGDIPVRYGGEEFLVILTDTTAQEALAFGQSMRELVASTTFPCGAKQPLGFVSISGGVATFPDDANVAGDLIAVADAKLYQSKQAGRNQVRG